MIKNVATSQKFRFSAFRARVSGWKISIQFSSMASAVTIKTQISAKL